MWFWISEHDWLCTTLALLGTASFKIETGDLHCPCLDACAWKGRRAQRERALDGKAHFFALLRTREVAKAEAPEKTDKCRKLDRPTLTWNRRCYFFFSCVTSIVSPLVMWMPALSWPDSENPHLGRTLQVTQQTAGPLGRHERKTQSNIGVSTCAMGYPGRSWTATPYISLVTSSAVQGYPRAKGQRCHSPLIWLPVLFMSFFFPSLLLRVSPTCFALTSDFSVGSLWLASTSFRLRGEVGMLGRGPLPCRYRPGSSPTHASTRLIMSSSRNMWRKCFSSERDHASCADGVFVCPSSHVFLFHL